MADPKMPFLPSAPDPLPTVGLLVALVLALAVLELGLVVLAAAVVELPSLVSLVAVVLASVDVVVWAVLCVVLRMLPVVVVNPPPPTTVVPVPLVPKEVVAALTKIKSFSTTLPVVVSGALTCLLTFCVNAVGSAGSIGREEVEDPSYIEL